MRIKYYLLAGVLLFAPLFRGANLPLPLLALELAALGLLAYVIWRPDFKTHLSRPMQVILGLLFIVPLWQLVPLPPPVWTALPGRDFYAQVLAQVDPGVPGEGWRAASLVPWRTEAAWLALLPPFGVFLVAVGLPTRQLQSLVKLFLGIAVGEAVFGLMQYGAGPGSALYLGNPYQPNSALGTYINRNHLAGLLEMALPLGLALLVASLGSNSSSPSSRRDRRTLRSRLGALASPHGNRALWYGAASLVILLGVIFTRSRAGITLSLLGIVLCALLFARRLGGNSAYGLVGLVTLVGFLLAVEIGLTPVVNRFVLVDPTSDSRWTLFASTLQVAAGFFPLGSGVGSFVDVYPRFHPPEMAFGGIVNRAHNDYLEYFMEAGLIGIVLVLAVLGGYARRWPGVWRRANGSSFRCAQAGAGIALLLMLLHSVLDFNLHIPANAVFFAFLAAVFWHRPRPEGEQPGDGAQRYRSEHRHDPVELPRSSLPKPPLDKVSNPFTD